MAELDDGFFQEDDHRGAYIFSAAGSGFPGVNGETASSGRPAKRRKVGKRESARAQEELVVSQTAQTDGQTRGGGFVPLLNGTEGSKAVESRAALFAEWDVLEGKIQDVLRKANGKTLEEVGAFLRAAENQKNKTPAGFIITGPNIASQDLLFQQLAEELCDDGRAKFVRLRSTEAPNLKAALKKIIRDSTSDKNGEDGEADMSIGQDGRKYLNYDLEALHVSLRKHNSRRVIVAFQDSEAFDNGLMMDLIQLFGSWQDRIHFSVLFGIATSVELFQARLLKSTARQLYGGQFDVVQADAVLEAVFKTAVAGTRATVRLGPGILRSLVDRQRDQVAGIQVFISSVKYAYMCHFYGNPLSFLLAEGNKVKEAVQAEHLQAVRSLDSFKAHVEAAVDARQLSYARSLLEDDDELTKRVLEQGQKRDDYLMQLLRSLTLVGATGLLPTKFIELYTTALAEGIDLTSEAFPLTESIRRLGPKDLVTLISRLRDTIQTGNPDLDLDGWETEADELIKSLTRIQNEIETLAERTKGNRDGLKSKYTAQSKVLRTTVVAQKVQLSRDTATLTDDDKAFTAAIDSLTTLLSQHLSSSPITDLFLHEAWVYDSKTPYRDVFIPKPGVTFGRALSRPHDYLSCACCKKGNGTLAATLPTTSVLYHLYLEAGALINVADLWAAYFALVGDENDSTEKGLDERTALVLFYRGLAELRMMGFVRASKKKADHVGKVKWL
ncbi:origin recognition complex subunit 3 N-terminus-domain-containing protein [Echria macrotheca]|uniref:Origin recognition complex subunit 3 N-terminus-domain-containing protein n=1 Tax=Echria macrotheca TaxID=438768 RepID=A0AAJ0F875_9PEZI|nr:origin recognition complex subunit 3 N-terminus-domain-containing protein [Echria macrotheca]